LGFKSIKKSRDLEIVPNTVYQIIETKRSLQGKTVFIFLMTHATTLAPTGTIDWDAVNIQTKHIVRTVCSFLAAAVPVNIVHISTMSGICLVKNSDQILCTVRPGQAKRLLIPLPPCFPEIGDRDNGEYSDAKEQQTYLEECTGLLYDLNLPDDEETLQTH
jgi:hypothetical protein